MHSNTSVIIRSHAQNNRPKTRIVPRPHPPPGRPGPARAIGSGSASPYEADMNCISVLQKIAEIATTVDGQKVAPVVWECNCLEEVCGACTMLINGRVRQACTALVDHLLADQPGEIELRPMTKFPVLRDLMVDRSRIFASLEKIKAWLPVDSYLDMGPGLRQSQETQQMAYLYSKCMSCGCCLEACPQFLKIELVRRPGETRRRVPRPRAHGEHALVHGRARHRAGRAVQHEPDRRDDRLRAARRADGRRRHPSLRQRPKLREGLPQGHPADHRHRPPRPRRHDSHAAEVVRSMRIVEMVNVFFRQGRVGPVPKGLNVSTIFSPWKHGEKEEIFRVSNFPAFHGIPINDPAFPRKRRFAEKNLRAFKNRAVLDSALREGLLRVNCAASLNS